MYTSQHKLVLFDCLAYLAYGSLLCCPIQQIIGGCCPHHKDQNTKTSDMSRSNKQQRAKRIRYLKLVSFFRLFCSSIQLVQLDPRIDSVPEKAGTMVMTACTGVRFRRCQIDFCSDTCVTSTCLLPTPY